MTISPEYNFYNTEAYESQCEWTLIQINSNSSSKN